LRGRSAFACSKGETSVQSATRTLAAALAATALLASACDHSSQTPVAKAQPSEETFRDFGSYEVHYNAVRTDALTPEIARNYGIQRSTNRVMLNVTVLHKEAGAAKKPVEADVKVAARNLNEQLKDLELRRVSKAKRSTTSAKFRSAAPRSWCSTSPSRRPARKRRCQSSSRASSSRPDARACESAPRLKK
jgi:hypothetical protein